MSDAVRYPWCTRLFRPRRGGHVQRNCRPWCRRAFHGAARASVLDAIASGALTLAEIRSGLPTTRALLSEAEGTLPRVNTAHDLGAWKSCRTRLPTSVAWVGSMPRVTATPLPSLMRLSALLGGR
jgi:hypothetical protein